MLELAPLLALLVLAQSQQPPPLTFERTMMSTRVAVGIADPLTPPSAQAAADAVFDIFTAIERDQNEWRPESALSRINASAGGPAVPAPPELCEVISLSLEGSRRTRGLFDPTWAALRGVWKFSPGAAPPAAAELKAACALVDHRKVTVLPAADGGQGCSVKLAEKGMALGLGGVVKGWGVDRAVAALRARGLSNFWVQAGGDLYLAGKNGARPWRSGIRDPRGPPEKTIAIVEVQDASFSTSGDYERFFEVGGRRFHHLIDPRTCQPAPKSRSATVVARTALDAEFLSKAIFIEGGAAGIALAESLGAEAVIVDAQGKLHVSRGLAGKLSR